MTWTASAVWDAYIADCGPYTGPWPPAPPIPANVPADSGEVDYWLSTDDLATVVAGGGTGLDVYRDSSGSASSGIGEPVITGARLYVFWYAPGLAWPAAAPAYDALTLVPPSYVSGGTGTAVGDPVAGHWSDWVDYPSALFYSGSGFSVSQRQRSAAATETVSGFVDVGPLETTVRDDMLAATPTADTTIHGFALFAMDTRKNGFDTATKALGVCQYLTVGDNSHGLAQCDLEHPGTFTLDDLNALLPYLPAGLIEGIDYVQPPAVDDNGLHVDFESGGTTAFSAWSTLHLDAHVQGIQSSSGTSAAANYSDVGFRVALQSGAPTASGWVADGAGTTLDTETVSLGSGVVDRPLTIDISTAPETFWINIQPVGYSTLTPPVADWTWVSGTDQNTVGWAIQVQTATADATLSFPRFRYWIPGPAGGPVLRTVGGHWATPGGSVFKMLIPGAGWTPMIDGTG